MEEMQNIEQKQEVQEPQKKSYAGLIILGIVVALIAIAAAVVGYHHFYTKPLMQENEELKELAELEKQEMEMQYREFDLQYEQLQQTIKNDSLIAQIEEERRKTQQLLEELERTKATDAAEIKRLKAEIASLREVLKSYIVQVDSLNRLNQSLNEENTQIKAQMTEATAQITNLATERNQLKDKVNIAAQLDATGFWVTPKNKKGKDTQKVKDVKRLAFGFTIVKNVTAQNGQRIVYARILKPDNSLWGQKGTFTYENTSLEYTEKKYIDYTGEEVKKAVAKGYLVVKTIPAHGTAIYTVEAETRLDRIIYEAESAYNPSYQELENNQFAGTGIYAHDDNCRSGMKATWVGGNEDNNLQFRHVYSSDGGTKQLTIAYLSGDDRKVTVEVNGKRIEKLTCNSGGYDKVGTATISIPLQKGNNTITLRNNRSYMPDIDYISVK